MAGLGADAATGFGRAAAAFDVVATTPADGEIVTAAPTQMQVDFSAGVLATSLDAADLTVDGLPATAVTLLDHDSAVFDLPGGLADGVNGQIII